MSFKLTSSRVASSRMSTVSSTLTPFHLPPRYRHVILYLSILMHIFHTDLIKYGINECFSFMKSHSNYGFSGFAAEAPASALQTLSAQDAKYNPNIEEDKVVSAYGDYAAAL